MNALGPSLAPYIRSSRTLKKWVTPIAQWYADLMGHRRMGLRYDDLRAYSTVCHTVYVVLTSVAQRSRSRQKSSEYVLVVEMYPENPLNSSMIGPFAPDTAGCI